MYVLLIQQNVKFKFNKSSNPFKFGTAEKKLIAVFCYYMVLAVVALTAFTLSTRNNALFARDVQVYFFCEQSGHNPSSPCSRSFIGELTYPSVTTSSYILLAISPVVNLVYAVDIQELKQLWKNSFVIKRSISSENPSTATVMSSIHRLRLTVVQ